MNRPDRPWPPLIVAGHVPRGVKWRDALLTLMMWGGFLLLLDTEFELFLGPHLERLGFGPSNRDANWAYFFERLMPFLLTAAVLGGALIVFGVLTLRRGRRGLLLPPPPRLETVDEARRAGLDEAALVAARDRRIVVVHIDADGRHRIVARDGGEDFRSILDQVMRRDRTPDEDHGNDKSND
jgi:poly-beta-1,6-N-acetyl-D-glucosamine biosynthesis protein PgaD